MVCALAENFHCLPHEIDDLPVDQISRMYHYVVTKNEQTEKQMETAKSGRGAPRVKAPRATTPVKNLTLEQFRESLKREASVVSYDIDKNTSRSAR